MRKVTDYSIEWNRIFWDKPSLDWQRASLQGNTPHQCWLAYRAAVDAKIRELALIAHVAPTCWRIKMKGEEASPYGELKIVFGTSAGRDKFHAAMERDNAAFKFKGRLESELAHGY